jgi:O-antigen ligase
MNRALAWLVAALFVVLPLAHVPALRNLLALGATLLVAAILVRERRRPPLPAWVMAAWIALGAASALWSAGPATTLHSVLYNMLLPAGVFLAAWRAAQEPGAFDRVRWAACGGILCLASLLAFVFASGQPAATFLPDATGQSRIYYWPGVGIASTFASLIVPFALLALASPRRAERYAGTVVLGAAIAVAMVSQNRVVWPTLVLSVIAFIAWLWPTLSTAGRRMTIGVVCAAAVAAWGAFDFAQRERRLDGREVTNDLRLQAWREWSAIAMQEPLLGHGFGRTRVSGEGRRVVSRELRQQEPHFASHAHNLFIDIAVQLGIVGVAVYLALLAALLREYWRLGGAGVPRPLRALGAAGFSLLIAMLAKNSTDDFMDQAVAIAFWGYAGILLGALSKRSKPA